MPMEIESKLGTIKLNTYIFEQIIEDAVNKSEGKAILATDKGRPANAVMSPEIILRDEGDTYHLEFYVIIEFGSSIKEVTNNILDRIMENLKSLQPDKNQRVLLRVVGVKSRQIAERNIECVRLYEINR